MPVTQAIGFEDAITSAGAECGWSEGTKNAVMLDFLVFAGQFDNNLLNVFDSFLQNRVADEKRAFEVSAEDEDEDEDDSDLDDDDDDDLDDDDDDLDDEFDDEDDDDSDLDDDDDDSDIE